jgi:hypothetical protein
LFRDQNSASGGTEPKEAAYAITGENADKGAGTQINDCLIFNTMNGQW